MYDLYNFFTVEHSYVRPVDKYMKTEFWIRVDIVRIRLSIKMNPDPPLQEYPDPNLKNNRLRIRTSINRIQRKADPYFDPTL